MVRAYVSRELVVSSVSSVTSGEYYCSFLYTSSAASISYRSSANISYLRGDNKYSGIVNSVNFNVISSIYSWTFDNFLPTSNWQCHCHSK